MRAAGGRGLRARGQRGGRGRGAGGRGAAMRLLRCLRKRAALAGVPTYIEHFSKFSPSPLSMKQFLDFGGYRSSPPFPPPAPNPGDGHPDSAPPTGVQQGERPAPPLPPGLLNSPCPCVRVSVPLCP